jgi:hypothetical protein
MDAMNDPHVAGLDRAHRFLDPLADEVEERRDLAGKVDADPELLLETRKRAARFGR